MPYTCTEMEKRNYAKCIKNRIKNAFNKKIVVKPKFNIKNIT